jgi:hypothetical protein
MLHSIIAAERRAVNLSWLSKEQVAQALVVVGSGPSTPTSSTIFRVHSTTAATVPDGSTFGYGALITMPEPANVAVDESPTF